MSPTTVTTAHCPTPDIRNIVARGSSPTVAWILRGRRAPTDDLPTLRRRPSFSARCRPHQPHPPGSAVTVLGSDDPYGCSSVLHAQRRQRRTGRASSSERGSRIDSFRCSGTTSPTTSSCSRRGRAVQPRSSRRHGHLAGQTAKRCTSGCRTAQRVGAVPRRESVSAEPPVGIRAREDRVLVISRSSAESPARFAPFSQFFQVALAKLGRPPCRSGALTRPRGGTDAKARDEFCPTTSRSSAASARPADSPPRTRNPSPA